MSKKEKEVGAVAILVAIILISAWFVFGRGDRKAQEQAAPAPSSSVRPVARPLTEEEKAQIMSTIPPSRLTEKEKAQIMASFSASTTVKK